MIKCPHCGYASGFNPETQQAFPTPKGDFFHGGIMIRKLSLFDTEKVNFVGCPNCCNTFIDRIERM